MLASIRGEISLQKAGKPYMVNDRVSGMVNGPYILNWFHSICSFQEYKEFPIVGNISINGFGALTSSFKSLFILS